MTIKLKAQELIVTARTLVADDKGLLAMDESNPTCNKRFARLGIPQTEELRRDLIANGELRRLIEEDGLRGMTSNPSIFEAAMSLSAHHEEIKNSEPKEQHKHELGVIHDHYSCNKNCETKN